MGTGVQHLLSSNVRQNLRVFLVLEHGVEFEMLHRTANMDQYDIWIHMDQ